MSKVRLTLTLKEKALLANLWEDKDTLRALSEALSQRQLVHAQNAVAAPDWDAVMQNRGRVEEDTWFLRFLKENFDDVTKARRAKAQ